MNDKKITRLSSEIEERIHHNPLLNIDTFIIPSPYIKDPATRKDEEHSYVWIEEGEILGYLLTYVSSDSSEFLIYKLVTSPFGRGRGIGSAFIDRLASQVPKDSLVYLYLWEKQTETLNFFRKKGFNLETNITYRNLVYHRLGTQSQKIMVSKKKKLASTAGDEIGRTRHDARKTLRSLNAMVNALAPENAGKIIEDINRETTTLLNMLNSYNYSAATTNEVNLKYLILERLIPYIETSLSKVDLVLTLGAAKPVVFGHWLDIGRALVNLVSNALDSMGEMERRGVLNIALSEKKQQIILRIADNGAGIPPQMMIPDKEGKPAFIGQSSKAKGKGEGLGSVQVWNTFGASRIAIKSKRNVGTEWSIRFDRSKVDVSRHFLKLERRFHELQSLHETIHISPNTSHTEVITAIWRLRKREIFLIDLILRFSRYHNIRDLYRTVLAYFQGSLKEEDFEKTVADWKGEQEIFKLWLSTTARYIRQRLAKLSSVIELKKYQGAFFKSYGQALNNVIVFTLNPSQGRFLATDRKLAEHLDFVPYLGGKKEEMLRGEFVGDVNINENPIYLGVWSVDSEEDLVQKLRFLQKGAQKILDFEIHSSKRLAFYQTTYIRHSRDIDSDASSTVGEFANLSDADLRRFTREAEDEMQGFLAAQD